MLNRLFIPLAFVALGALFSAGALAQDDAEAPPTPDEECKAFLAEKKKLVGKEDAGESLRTAQKLVQWWNVAEVDEKTKKPIPDMLEKIAKSKDEKAAIAGLNNLAKLGADEAGKPIRGILDKALKAKEPSVQVYTLCFKLLGELADTNKKSIKSLVDYLKHQNNDVVGKAMRALAGYKEAPGSVRKDMLEEVIKQSEGVYSRSLQSNNKNDQRKWNIIKSGTIMALNALSGQRFKDPTEARSWFNDNKKNRDVWKD